MSFVVGSGLCALFGVPYGPVHTSLPFLLMGLGEWNLLLDWKIIYYLFVLFSLLNYTFLGVDDMFVILACWEELTSEQQKLPIHEKIGLTMKHAGVSISITSFTDVIAFLIGASTVSNIFLSISKFFYGSCQP